MMITKRKKKKKRFIFTLSHSAVFSCQLKKYAVWELQVKFYLRQNEDCSLGDSVSDSSEKLLQRGKGKAQYICDFGEGGVHAIKYVIFCRRFLLVMRSSCHHEGFHAFLDKEDIRTGLIKLAPENIYLEMCPVSSPTPSTECLITALHPELLSGLSKINSTCFYPVEVDGKCQFVVDTLAKL